MCHVGVTVCMNYWLVSWTLHSNRKRGTAESSLSHNWLMTEQADAKKIATKRLKSFRARRRWLVRNYLNTRHQGLMVCVCVISHISPGCDTSCQNLAGHDESGGKVRHLGATLKRKKKKATQLTHLSFFSMSKKKIIIFS